YTKKNLSIFKISTEAMEDPKMSENIDALIKDVLAKQWDIIKQKHTSVALLNTLAPSRYYEITTHHWACFAFLRGSLKSFNKLVMESMAAKLAILQKSKNCISAGHEEGGEVSEGNDDSNPQTANEDSGLGEVQTKQPRIWVASDFWEYVDLLLSDLRD
ncbi:hypothetical protein BDN67DRAFT_871044, partial [Paxillus ammoniavirescens]